MSLIKTFTTMGPPDSHQSYSKQKILCHLTGEEVILTAQQNGVVVCSEWKKCEKHRQKGVRPCPEMVADAILLKTLREEKKKGFRFLSG